MTIQQVKDKVAMIKQDAINKAKVKLGYSNTPIEYLHHKAVVDILELAIEIYAAHKIEEQIKVAEAAAEVKPEYRKGLPLRYIVDKQSILNCIRVKLN